MATGAAPAAAARPRFPLPGAPAAGAAAGRPAMPRGEDEGMWEGAGGAPAERRKSKTGKIADGRGGEGAGAARPPARLPCEAGLPGGKERAALPWLRCGVESEGFGPAAPLSLPSPLPRGQKKCIFMVVLMPILWPLKVFSAQPQGHTVAPRAGSPRCVRGEGLRAEPAGLRCHPPWGPARSSAALSPASNEIYPKHPVIM